jgi:hypothetical protein
MAPFTPAIALSTLVASVAAANTVLLPHISGIPSNASQVLDSRLASFSFEFSFLPTFAGNATHPNALTQASASCERTRARLWLMFTTGAHAAHRRAYGRRP